MKRILIIEDDAAVAYGLVEALKAEHFEPVHAATGAVGMQKATRERVDLIILDLLLPDMNGEQICKDLRSKGFATPILMLTSKAEEMDKVLGLEIGADDYVTKPFSLRELIARVAHWSEVTAEEVRTILLKLEERADFLCLQYKRKEGPEKLLDVTALATSLAMDFAYTGRLTG